MRTRYLFQTAGVLFFVFGATAVLADQVTIAATSVLRPGDHVRITVLSEDKNLSGEFEVAPDSTLKHPLYNQVKVVGIPVTALKERFATFLRRFQREPQLEVEPLFKVSVGGEVRSPGVFFLPPETTISDAIARAGGTLDRADLNQVNIIRDGRKLSLRLAETSGNRSSETIQSGDQISVAQRRNVMGSITPLLGIGVSLASIIVLLISR